MQKDTQQKDGHIPRPIADKAERTGTPVPSGAKSEVTGGFPEDINGMPSTGNFVGADGKPRENAPDGSGLSETNDETHRPVLG